MLFIRKSSLVGLLNESVKTKIIGLMMWACMIEYKIGIVADQDLRDM